MNIQFHNLGKITNTELDLKPLTVIVGPNNSNKTYIAYSIYGLWQSMLATPIRFPKSRSSFSKDEMGVFSASIEELHKAFTSQINLASKSFASELGNFYQDSSQSLFSETRYAIDFTMTEFREVLNSLSGTRVNPLNESYSIIVDDSRISLAPMRSEPSFEEEEDLNLSPDFIGRSILSLIRRQVFSRPYLLPAERNAFVITYKVLANRRLKLLLDAQRRLFSSRGNNTTQRQLDLLREVGEVRYPQPVEDFLELLFQIENEVRPISAVDDEASFIQTSGRQTRRRRPAQSELRKLAADIEQYIQNGNTINFRPTALGGQEIMVDVGGGLNIDLYNASSSIKQLAPLLLYLRYRAERNDLLIIDEPEMNLHPASQVKLLEILAMLVNQGVNVLLTTHSPYVMAHLNNLVQPEEMSAANKRRKAKSLYLNNASSLLKMNQVSAYEMRGSQLHSLKDPDYGIRWDTFSDVSSELQQKYFAIHE